MNYTQTVDAEKMAFEQIERQTPMVAEMLLRMAARPAPLHVLTEQLRVCALADELGEDYYLTAVIALRYARRYLTGFTISH